MVALFKKDEKIKSISAEEKQKLSEESRNLGYEVGYHRHSEIGWVQEHISRLDEFAAQYGLKDFVREQYNLGKEEGSRSKDRDTKSGLSKGAEEKDDGKRVDISIESLTAKMPASNVESGYKSSSYTSSNCSAPIEQPSLVSLPENVELPRAVGRPALLGGSTHLLPKK
ncbi:hypothetical protein V7O66_10640 [Methanolobus sp. ZRKC3]|uniref:hypothetical protein n=1 Tax=Methanolobus sp. ZRKC3 TaxID=3125786 RepID=UPI00325585CD